jgi:hypothetical protein
MPSTTPEPGGASGPGNKDQDATKGRPAKSGEDAGRETGAADASAGQPARAAARRSRRAKAGAGEPEPGAGKTAAKTRRAKGRDDFRFYRQRIDRLVDAVDEVEQSGSHSELGRAALSQQFALHFPLHLALVETLADMGVANLPPLEEAQYRGLLIGLLLDERSDDALLPGQVRLAVTLIRDLIHREEAPKTGLLAKARGEGIPEPALERRIAACMADHDGRSLRKRPPMADQEDDMPRYSDTPDRDERGRFVSDDDRGGSRGGNGRSSRSSYDDDDRRYSQGGRSSGSSRYDDDDRRYSSSRGGRDDGDHGQGGWFGDREGHAEAARRGWESRDDDRRYSQGGRSSGSSRYDDDDRRYSSSRGGRDDGDHGQGGWFGDREGHAEAARRGWENRDNDRGGSSRSSGRRG